MGLDVRKLGHSQSSLPPVGKLRSKSNRIGDFSLKINRGAPDPDPAGYPVDLVDLVQIRIRPDPTSEDPV